ncbi:MAG: GNAT family N-acetyltransferase [Firmicutes bacterium]|nr:GNAT family N-acetyltransferase [Bacillota bacterium]
MNLKIRRFKAEDLQSLYELLSDEEVMRFIEPPFTFDQTRAFLENSGLTDNPLIYAVEDEGRIFIGYVIYHDYEEDSKEIGWILKKQFWGKGLAEALTERLIQKANADGKSVVIECSPEQKATKRIAEKLGFIYMGLIDGCNVYKLD